MTAKDYELIAAVLADCEARIVRDEGYTGVSDDQTRYGSSILASISLQLENSLARDNSRFDRERFRNAARPVKAERQKQAREGNRKPEWIYGATQIPTGTEAAN